MNVREYLESIRALDLSIESKIRQEEMLRTRLTDTDGFYRLFFYYSADCVKC